MGIGIDISIFWTINGPPGLQGLSTCVGTEVETVGDDLNPLNTGIGKAISIFWTINGTSGLQGFNSVISKVH